MPTEISPGRRCWRTAKCPDARLSALGSFSERSLKVRRLLRGQDQRGAIPLALTTLRDANTGAGQDPHRPGCGASTPPSCRGLCRRPQGLQALQRCSGLLNRRARGSTGGRPQLTSLAQSKPWQAATETRRRGRRPCGCESCREHQPSLSELRPGEPIWPASIRVMQRTFNPLNRERYPGGPPDSMPGRLTAGPRPLKASVVVRVHPRQPFSTLQSAPAGYRFGK